MRLTQLISRISVFIYGSSVDPRIWRRVTRLRWYKIHDLSDVLWPIYSTIPPLVFWSKTILAILRRMGLVRMLEIDKNSARPNHWPPIFSLVQTNLGYGGTAFSLPNQSAISLSIEEIKRIREWSPWLLSS